MDINGDFIFPEVSPPPNKNPENSGLELHINETLPRKEIWDASHHAATVLPGIFSPDFLG